MKAETEINVKLVIAFIQGAKFWEYRQTGGTMWQLDQLKCAEEATNRLTKGTLGEQDSSMEG